MRIPLRSISKICTLLVTLTVRAMLPMTVMGEIGAIVEEVDVGVVRSVC